MTEPANNARVPGTDLPFEDARFEVETEAMPDGRQIHYYRWPEHATPASDEARSTDV